MTDHQRVFVDMSKESFEYHVCTIEKFQKWCGKLHVRARERIHISASSRFSLMLRLKHDESIAYFGPGHSGVYHPRYLRVAPQSSPHPNATDIRRQRRTYKVRTLNNLVIHIVLYINIRQKISSIALLVVPTAEFC